MPIADLIKIPTVQAFLMDGAVMTVFEAILEKFALSKERAIELLDLTDAVLDGSLQLADIPALIQQAFGVEEARAVRMACDVVGFRLLPLEEYVPGVVAQIAAWGGDLGKYPQSRVGKLKMTADTFAAKLDDQLGFDFSEVLVKRCGFLLYAYWKGEKTKESTLTFFSRASSIGGLGLSPEQAQRLLAAIDDERDMIEVVESGAVVTNTGEDAIAELEADGEKMKAENQGEVPETTSVVPVLSHELVAEVPIVSAPKSVLAEHHPELIDGARTAKRLVSADRATGEALEAAVVKAVHDATSLLVARKIAQEIFAEVVRKALKGVRDLYQTRDVLSRDFKFAGEDLEKVTEIIEEAHRRVHLSSPSVTPRMSAEEATSAPRGETLLDQRFAAIAQDDPGERVEEVLPGSRVSLARTVEEERAQQAAAIPAAKLVDAAVASRPAPVKPMLTVGSLAPAGKDSVLTDVKPVRRLMGPIEELMSMTPVEFRRLSTTPADAAQKVEDILATLESQSYEERVKGIQAWRQSPMNQMYVAMMAEALEKGVALAEIAGQRRSAGEESLSTAEISAVAALNERLRF
jgi:hypothetical protein